MRFYFHTERWSVLRISSLSLRYVLANERPGEAGRETEASRDCDRDRDCGNSLPGREVEVRRSPLAFLIIINIKPANL